MLVSGIVAAALCAGVVVALIVTARRTRQAERDQYARDCKLVTDCLANAERVIDLTAATERRQSISS